MANRQGLQSIMPVAATCIAIVGLDRCAASRAQKCFVVVLALASGLYVILIVGGKVYQDIFSVRSTHQRSELFFDLVDYLGAISPRHIRCIYA